MACTCARKELRYNATQFVIAQEKMYLCKAIPTKLKESQ